MRLSTLHQSQGFILHTKGALEAVLPRCTYVDGTKGIVPLDLEAAREFARAERRMAGDGLRVLALAFRQVAGPGGGDVERFENELVLCGLVGLEDPPRPEVPAAIATCKRAGIRVIMVTGDHPQTAVAIARQIGLLGGSDRPVVVEGGRLRRMSDVQLQLALDAPEILFARVAADQKMRIVDALRRKGEVVAATGDGVNDAPALKRADIGIAMGLSGTDIAREAADLILLDDNFATIVAAVEEGRTVYANIRKFLTYILTSNVPELVPYLAFVLFKVPLALTVIQILAVDLGTDMLPALALGADPPSPGVMREPPRRRGERLLGASVLARSYLFLGLLEAAAAMAAFFYVLVRGGWNIGQVLGGTAPLYLTATTACLAAIVSAQVVNVFICRSSRESVVVSGFLKNFLLAWAIAVELGIILAIVYTPQGNTVFGTAPIPTAAWLVCVPFVVAMLAAEELRKSIVRRLASKPTTEGDWGRERAMREWSGRDCEVVHHF
jgi:magnesium-transporting ATPase (P-type)